MNRFWITLCAAALSALPLTARDEATVGTKPASQTDFDLDQWCEMLGYLVGTSLEGPGFSLNLEAIIRGIRNGAAGGEAPMSLEEYQSKLERLQELAFETQAAVNLRNAEAFLLENSQREGIIELESGKLQYCVVCNGDGPVVPSGAVPLVHYTGRYPDGSVFGTSTDGEPVPMALDQTLPGFARAVVGMKQGEKRVVFLHPELGYGKSGALAPNSALVFEVEVLKADTRETTSEL